ncbi:hypothetical protein ACFLUO_06705 [Chloroflexota bacterium]
MNIDQLKIRTVIMLSLLLVISLGGGCAPDRDFDNRLKSIARPYHLNIVELEINAIFREAVNAISGRYEKRDDEISKVTEYYYSAERIKSLKSEIGLIDSGSKQGDVASLKAELNKLQRQNLALESIVERTVERQIRDALSREGIFNPIDKYLRLKVGFPPVIFTLTAPPHLLVVSPRDRIESMREVLLQKSISEDDMESIEARVDKLGVSSLVIELGGLAVFPRLVSNRGDIRFTIDTAAEEWVHQYLTFKPLGFRYLLDLSGISRNYEIATMNETLTGMVSKEIGSIIYEEYYVQDEQSETQPEAGRRRFDFNREMREIRKAVDNYLAQGEVEQAEEFMEQKRQYLASNGYHIRKLNQAYFAFHGTYADSPTSINPIGIELKKLRSQSASLKDFMETAAAMTSRQELKESIK